MKITVETAVKAKLNEVWNAWNNPSDIKQWKASALGQASIRHM